MSDDGSGREGSRDDVGTVAEEAAKLFAALSGWAHDVDDHLATGAAECSYCPICRTVHVLRQTSPEVRAHLATAASSLVQAASGLLAAAVPEDRRRGAGVEHIDLDDASDDWPADDPDDPDDADHPDDADDADNDGPGER